MLQTLGPRYETLSVPWYTKFRSGSRAAATSKMECFVIIVNYYHKALHLGCCSSPRSASEIYNRYGKLWIMSQIIQILILWFEWLSYNQRRYTFTLLMHTNGKKLKISIVNRAKPPFSSSASNYDVLSK